MLEKSCLDHVDQRRFEFGSLGKFFGVYSDREFELAIVFTCWVTLMTSTKLYVRKCFVHRRVSREIHPWHNIFYGTSHMTFSSCNDWRVSFLDSCRELAHTLFPQTATGRSIYVSLELNNALLFTDIPSPHECSGYCTTSSTAIGQYGYCKTQ